ncbi:DEAD/DEAH box helicase [Candidatus Pacearchaeota archaeon]|nr:DEAD/DEAH box helicase [Candidatus Pacearchaeota archaeon]
MPKDFTPRPYQEQIIDHILQHPRCAIWAGMGMGKTVATLSALNVLRLIGLLEKPALVLAPLRVAQSTWLDEVEKWSHLNDIKVCAIIGNPKQRLAALEKLKSGEYNLFTTNYENIQWLVETIGVEHWPFETVIADESTKLKSFRTRQGGKRARFLGRVTHTKIKRFIQLTGTPSPNGLKDLWGQIWFLDAGIRLGKSYTAFAQRWFQKAFNGFGIDPLPYAQEQIEKALQGVCLSIDPADHFDIDEPITNVIKVKLPPRARRHYDNLEKLMYTELVEDGEEHEIEAFNAAARTMKCLQAASGALYVGENNRWSELHKEKLKALEDIIEEAAGMPVLVSYHFKSDLARLRTHFPKGKQLDKNPQTIKDWNAGKIPVMFAHPASAGHGLNLQDGGNILVFFSHNWNLEEYLQIIERIGTVRQKQAGHDRPVFIHYIVAENTVDEMVMARRETKKTVQDLLLEALKARS